MQVAIDHDKPVRIGVNWGSLDKALLTELMDANAANEVPKEARDVMFDAMVASAMRSASLAEDVGLAHDRILLSVKMSLVQDLIDVYRLLAPLSDYPLHLGLTEAGMGIRALWRVRRPWAPSSSKASATPYGSRSHRRPAATARRRCV